MALEHNEYDTDSLKDFNYPFTNIVLEGGGSKGLAYVGALQVFEEVGIAPNIKRICGASAGSIAGALLAVDYDSKKLYELLSLDMQKILIDHKWGIFSLIPNVIWNYGWNPGNRFLEWFGELLRETTGDADITFEQVYRNYGKELCIVVTNVNQMSTEYLHPKTCPDMPIRKAVRMSMSIPGVFQTVSYSKFGEEDLYVDGGMLCNYPIHAFDGWFLSMKPEHSYFKIFASLKDLSKLYAKDSRFGEWNPETVGLLLFSNSETELLKERLQQRPGNVLPKQPEESNLFKKRKQEQVEEAEMTEKHEKIMIAAHKFVEDLVQLGYDDDSVITIDEIEKVFKKTGQFTMEHRLNLFGNPYFRVAFRELDKNNDGRITFSELRAFIEQKGVDLQEKFVGYRKKKINSFKDFLSTLLV